MSTQTVSVILVACARDVRQSVVGAVQTVPSPNLIKVLGLLCGEYSRDTWHSACCFCWGVRGVVVDDRRCSAECPAGVLRAGRCSG